MSECLCAVVLFFVFFLTSIFSITNHSSGEYNSFIVMEYLSHIQQFLQDRCRLSQRWAGVAGIFFF